MSTATSSKSNGQRPSKAGLLGDLSRVGSDLAVLSVLAGALTLVLAVVATWLLAIGLGLDQMMGRATLAMLGGAASRSPWTVGQCLEVGLGLVPAAAWGSRRWWMARADQQAADPVKLLGAWIRPGPVSIGAGVISGLLVLTAVAYTVGIGESTWRATAAAAAAACCGVFVWRAGANTAEAGQRASILWVVSAALAAAGVGGLTLVW
jgi:hypothetical protein